MIGHLRVDAEPRADAMAVTILRVLNRGDSVSGDGALTVDLLVPVAKVAPGLDLGGPVGTLYLGDLVRGDRRLLAEFLGLRLEVVRLGVTTVDQRFQLGVLGLELRIRRLEAIEAFGERTQLGLHGLDVGLGCGAPRLRAGVLTGQQQGGSDGRRQHGCFHGDLLGVLLGRAVRLRRCFRGDRAARAHPAGFIGAGCYSRVSV